MENADNRIAELPILESSLGHQCANARTLCSRGDSVMSLRFNRLACGAFRCQPMSRMWSTSHQSQEQ